MGIEVSSQPQIFHNSSVVVGTSGGAAVEGLTVYGDVSASGWLWGSNGTFVKTVAAGNGGTTYQLQFYPTLRPEDYIVSINGVVQEPGAAYSITRTEPAPANIVFTENVAVGAKIVVVALRNLASNTKSTATFKKNIFTTVNGQEAYALTHYTNASSENYLVFLDGVLQSPDSDYTIEYGGASAVVVVPGVSGGLQLVVLALFNTDGTHATTSAGLTVQNNGGLESTVSRLNFVSGLTGTVAGNVVNLSAAAAGLTTSSFTSNQLLSSKGYQRFPGGLIMQWGSLPTTNGNQVSVAVVFAIPFPTEVASFNITANTNNRSTNMLNVWSVYNYTLTGFTARTQDNDSTPYEGWWVAIGY